jgi:hypothetical protein
MDTKGKINYKLIQDFETLADNYSYIIDSNNNFIGYINEFISVKVGGTLALIGDEKVIFKQAKTRKTDKQGRSCRPIITIYADRQIENNDIKKVYRNSNGNYFYSFDKEQDEYICSFDELQLGYGEIQKREYEKTDNMVLVSGLQVWVYSERWDDIFLNTIEKVECNQVYTREYKKAIPVKYIFLTKQQADDFNKNYKTNVYNSLLRNNEWLWMAKAYIGGNVKINRCQKRSLLEIMDKIDKSTVTFKEYNFDKI